MKKLLPKKTEPVPNGFDFKPGKSVHELAVTSGTDRQHAVRKIVDTDVPVFVYVNSSFGRRSGNPELKAGWVRMDDRAGLENHAFNGKLLDLHVLFRRGTASNGLRFSIDGPGCKSSWNEVYVSMRDADIITTTLSAPPLESKLKTIVKVKKRLPASAERVAQIQHIVRKEIPGLKIKNGSGKWLKKDGSWNVTALAKHVQKLWPEFYASIAAPALTTIRNVLNQSELPSPKCPS